MMCIEKLIDMACAPDVSTRFQAESNRIEGISTCGLHEVEALRKVLRSMLTVDGLAAYVATVQYGARLRSAPGLDARIGSRTPSPTDYICPPGGPALMAELEILLADTRSGRIDPWTAHCAYEALHPFTDGNGRSGRALWLWAMIRAGERETRQAIELGFLHAFYYQTLRARPLDAKRPEARP